MSCSLKRGIALPFNLFEKITVRRYIDEKITRNYKDTTISNESKLGGIREKEITRSSKKEHAALRIMAKCKL